MSTHSLGQWWTALDGKGGREGRGCIGVGGNWCRAAGESEKDTYLLTEKEQAKERTLYMSSRSNHLYAGAGSRVKLRIFIGAR